MLKISVTTSSFFRIILHVSRTVDAMYIKQYETNNYVRETITIYVTRHWFLAARLLKQSVAYLVCHVYGCM